MTALRRRDFWRTSVARAFRWATDAADHLGRIVLVASLFGLSIVAAIAATFHGAPAWLAPLVILLFVSVAVGEGSYEAWVDVARQVSSPAQHPALRVSDRVEVDTSVACFRLRLWNDRLPRCQPRVTADKIVNGSGESLLQAAPLELGWTHHEGRRAELGPQDRQGETVAVLWLHAWPEVAGAPTHVFLYGQPHRQSLGRLEDFQDGSIEVDVSAYAPEYDDEPIRRTLTFTYDDTAPLKFRAKVEPA